MAQKLVGPLPLQVDLNAGYVVEFTAVDATTGADVTAVNVSNVSLLVANVAGGDLSADNFDATPLWVPIPNDQLSS